MTNPASAMRMLIIYAISIPMAILVGYLLTDPLDYGTLGFLGLIIALLISPIFIKWHYPILIFGLGCPATCFFLIGKPPLWQVVVILSLGISIIERTLTLDRRFISAPVMTWPLLFIVALTVMTAELTGGIGLHQLGGAGGGGKKYLTIFIGIAAYFALTSRVIPKERRNLYVAFYFLSTTFAAAGDLFAQLPAPLNYLNLIFPPSFYGSADTSVGSSRLVAVGTAFSLVTAFMLAKYGLRGIFLSNRVWRAPLFLMLFTLAMLGGYRSLLITYVILLTLLFFMEGLHRTRLLPAFMLVGVLGAMVMGVFSDKLPYSFQRSMCFIPYLKWDEAAILDAQNSSEWRERIWAATWPQVPQYLLLGRGYSLNAQDFERMGGGEFAGMGAQMDASQETLAVSGDYHSGPLTTLMPFGIWGAIGILWLMAASTFVLYRNYQYGDPELKTVNAYFLACHIAFMFSFFFIFGGFHNDVGSMAKTVGLSIALNWGVRQPQPKLASNPRIKPLPATAPQPA